MPHRAPFFIPLATRRHTYALTHTHTMARRTLLLLAGLAALAVTAHAGTKRKSNAEPKPDPALGWMTPKQYEVRDVGWFVRV